MVDHLKFSENYGLHNYEDFGTIVFGLKIIWRSFNVISRSFDENLNFFTPLKRIDGLTNFYVE